MWLLHYRFLLFLSMSAGARGMEMQDLDMKIQPKAEHVEKLLVRRTGEEKEKKVLMRRELTYAVKKNNAVDAGAGVWKRAEHKKHSKMSNQTDLFEDEEEEEETSPTSPLDEVIVRSQTVNKEPSSAHKHGRSRLLPHILHIGAQTDPWQAYLPPNPPSASNFNANADRFTRSWNTYYIGAQTGQLAKVYLDSWTHNNPGWRLDVLTDSRIMELARNQPPEVKSFLEAGVKFGVEKSDIGRLIALVTEGGVYVDNDVEDYLPVDKWPIHYHFQEKNVDLILGVEFPRPADGNPLQLTNFAMAALPGNGILSHALNEIVADAVHIADTKPNIVYRTGSIALTSAVLESLKKAGVVLPDISEFNAGNGHLFHLKDGMKVLILPYRAFCYHPSHGNDVVKEPFTDHLVEHRFFGTWKDH